MIVRDGVAGAPFVNTGFTINVGGSLTCTGTYTVTQDDLDTNGNNDDGDIDNLATADSDETPEDDGEDSVRVTQEEELGGNPTPTPRPPTPRAGCPAAWRATSPRKKRAPSWPDGGWSGSVRPPPPTCSGGPAGRCR